MKRRLALLLPLALAACQDTNQPTSLDTGDAALSRSANTVDVIVSLKTGFAPGGHAANEARAQEIARGLGITPRYTYGAALFGFAATIPEGRLNALRNDPRVAYVDFDAPVSIPDRGMAPPWSGGGGSTTETLPWGVDRIDAELNANEGAGIHVYILDTGIDSDHPDLQNNIGNGYAAVACKGGGCKASWDDDHDHGTHVAGTVGAIKGNSKDVVGVAAEVRLHAVKVLDKAGFGSRSGIIAGINWMVDDLTQKRASGYNNAAVANMSLGGSGSKGSNSCTSSGFNGTDAYYQAICNATGAGVIFAVAAGNNGADAEGAAPAAFDDAVVTVSATSSVDAFESWSNWGNNSVVWGALSVTHAPVAIGAPGGNILSTKRGGGTTTMSGTSMATPHVAGAIALFLTTHPQLAAYSAFENARANLLGSAEATTGFGNEDSTHPHAEKFLNAEQL